MDLFADNYYQLDSENKIDYYNVLYDPTTDLSGTYAKTVGTDNILEQTLTTALLNGTGHIQNTSTKQYCYEKQITLNIKKIILE